ncbi:HAD-IG family 5'-nucleotidase [soil metagenome]
MTRNTDIPPGPPRGLFCNRTLNLRKIGAIGYDMDYTLIHYYVDLWEARAFSYLRANLVAQGWPVEHLEFDPNTVTQGLIIDTELGNIVKANRFGYVKRAFHGTQPLSYEATRKAYRRTPVELHDRRWRFMNTLFSLSEAAMYMHLVDLRDAGKLDASLGYDALYRHTRQALDEAHLEGLLKNEIVGDPDRYVDLDPEMPLTLLDQKESGKKVMLITNSEWEYAAPMLTYAFDPFLPDGMTWRDLFHFTIVGARKPEFFHSRASAFEVVSDDGLLREHRGPLREGGIYVGGNAALVEASLGLSTDDILFVGDHIYADVKMSKSTLRWRTALVARELEDEISALQDYEEWQSVLTDLMGQKERLEDEFSLLRLDRQRIKAGYSPHTDANPSDLDKRMRALREELIKLDQEIAPIAQRAGRLVNDNWGPLLRAGNDKSHLARQIEQSADIYTARVSNFLRYTPFVFLRSHRGSMPHDLAAPLEEGGEEAEAAATTDGRTADAAAAE